MKCAIYIRVSTKLQAEADRFSLSAQTHELHQYAEQQGWKVLGEFKDVESGGQLQKKGLNAMLDLVEDGIIDVVLCIDQDRLSRLDTVAWEYLKSQLRENNVMIAEPGSLTDLKDEDQEFISDIKNLIARREKKSIVKRMMRGKRQMMRDGKPWGKGPSEYIYNKNDGTFSINEKTAWVIPMIDRLYLDEELGMNHIANKLNEVGPTPNGNDWNETLVYRRLVSTSYHGVMTKEFSNGETIQIEGAFPPLRSKETYEKIIAEREKRSKQYKITSRSRRDQHMLRRTYITCGECGRKINLSQNGNKNNPRYYLHHGRKRRMSDGGMCRISINTVRVDQNIINAIKNILTDEQVAEQYVDLNHDDESMLDLEESVKELNNKINKSQEKTDRLIDLYLDGNFDKEQLDQRQNTLQAEIKELTTQKDRYENKLKLIKKDEWNYDLIYEYLSIAENFDVDLSGIEQAKMMGDLFPTGTLYYDKLVLNGLSEEKPIQIEIPINEDPFAWHKSKKLEWEDYLKGKGYSTR